MRSDSEYVGGIPVVVSLASDDVLHPTDRPAPAAFVLPRTTMLIAVVPDLLLLFRSYATALHPESTQVWFSVGDAPVSWLYPAGVVKDYVNECTREERLAQYSAAAAAAAAPSSPLSTSQPSLVQSLPASVPSEPLELTFHIHSITKGSVRAGAVPLYVNYDRLEEHVRMEVKQAHKAAYTCLYGNYTHYQREAESTLLPAIGLALYRPFDEAAQHQLREQRMQAQDAAGRGGGMGVGSRGRYSSSAFDFSSPFLLLQYQQLLHSVLAPRPHVAYLVRVAFPYAFRGAASRFETGHLQYEGHRVSAAPALAHAPAAEHNTDASSPPSPCGSPIDRSNDVSGSGAAALVEAERLTLGLLLWRLFRIPVLRWQALQAGGDSSNGGGGGEGGAAGSAGLTEAQRTYQCLLQSLSCYYADPPACATAALEEQEPLLNGTPAEPPAWAAWEAAMAHALITDYEGSHGGERVGLVFHQAFPSAQQSQRRIRFVVQGLQPSLATPASFLEAHLSSSDRAIYVTVQV